jgi:hypothetical protein
MVRLSLRASVQARFPSVLVLFRLRQVLRRFLPPQVWMLHLALLVWMR